MCAYSLSAIFCSDNMVAGWVSKIKIRSATYILLRMGVGVVKEIRRAAIAACKASPWHKFRTGSYLLLRIQRKIGQVLGH